MRHSETPRTAGPEAKPELSVFRVRAIKSAMAVSDLGKLEIGGAPGTTIQVFCQRSERRSFHSLCRSFHS
jgi:hypothetical protein